LDQRDAEERYFSEPVTETEPAKAFEQRWGATLLDKVVNPSGRVRRKRPGQLV